MDGTDENVGDVKFGDVKFGNVGNVNAVGVGVSRMISSLRPYTSFLNKNITILLLSTITLKQSSNAHFNVNISNTNYSY